MSTKERDFSGGSRSSSSIMDDEVTPLQVQKFMETSFYLPVDILKSRDWHVLPIRVMTGEDFQDFVAGHNNQHFHYLEDKALLERAQFVAVSARRRSFTRTYYYVCKIWYGAAPK